MANVTVHQLNSNSNGNAYLNPTEMVGGIAVYAHLYECPVFLAQEGHHVWLYVFDGQEWADEFFEMNDHFDKVTKIEPVK